MQKIHSKFRLNRGLLLAMPILCGVHAAQAQTPCASGDPLVIAVSCNNLSLSASYSSVTINSNATVITYPYTDLPAVDVTSGSAIKNLTINGVIAGTKPGIYDQSGIHIVNDSSIETLTNSASGAISSSAVNNGFTYFAAIYDDAGTITTLNNSGRIYATAGSTAYAIVLGGRGIVNTLNNSGSIVGQLSGILVSGVMNTLNNYGSITGGVANNPIALDGLWLSSAGVMTSINNIGTISGSALGYGIKNEGTIGTLNNYQSGLKLEGKLPANYNVIVVGTSNYGTLAVSNTLGLGNGVTNFGIYPGSNLQSNKTYANVITGVSASNFAAGVAPSGVYGSGLVVSQVPWRLSNTGAGWSLITDASPAVSVNPVVSGSASGTSLAAAISTATVIASNGGKNPTLTSGFDLAGAAQSLTASQLSALMNAHAEGYSSNMTICLEQMGNVSNAVMDRIHTQLSGSGNTAASYRIEGGRYVWLDIADFRGDVRDNNALSGFGYQQQNTLLGADLLRNSQGGIGVFGGVGYSNMTSSQQVTQTFSNTHYFLGMYGGLLLSDGLKISGAGGYVAGSSNATRINPTIGNFAGGPARSSYGSSGVFAAVKVAKIYQSSASFSVTPFAGASLSQQWTDSVSETGGGDFNYGINNATAYTAVTFAGGELLLPLTHSGSNPLTLVGTYRYAYNWFADNASAHSITANSPVFGAFNQTGANMGAVSNSLGLGLQGNINEASSLRIGLVTSINTYGTQWGGGAEFKFRF